MWRTSTSRPCPKKNRYEPTKQQKKDAKFLPAYEAYRGLLSRTLGLHHWLARNWKDAIVSLIGVLLLVGGIVVTSTDLLDPNHAHFCCYPKSAPHGTLGSCTDPGATIHSHPDKQTCHANGPQFWIVTGAYLAVAVGLYYFAHVTRKPFYEACQKQYEELKVFVESKTIPANVDEKEAKLMETSRIREWQSKQWGLSLLIIMPESLLFGLHFRTFGKTILYYIFNLCLWSGLFFALLFFTTAQPLDDAWGCYPNPTLRSTNLGRCDDPKSDASKQFRDNSHLEFYWICVGVMAVGLSIAGSLLVYSIVMFRSLYAKRVAKRFHEKRVRV